MESHTTGCVAFVKVIIAVYFSEPGLFKELQAIQIEIFLGFFHPARYARWSCLSSPGHAPMASSMVSLM
jgi:hypothetical protein